MIQKMVWETKAENAILDILLEATWDPKNGYMRTKTGYDSRGFPAWETLHDLKALNDRLYTAGSEAWCGEVPWENGPVFEYPDDLHEQILMRPKWVECLRLMGWATYKTE